MLTVYSYFCRLMNILSEFYGESSVFGGVGNRL